MSAAAASFYCVADERYFLGAVGLVNSLRLVGHDEPIRVLDCGLTAAQRALLEPEVELIGAEEPRPPWLLKCVAPLRRPAEVMVLLDADLVATRALTDPIADAAAGSVVAFANPEDRFVAEWGELLDLGELTRGPYLSSAAVFLPRSPGIEILERMERLQPRVDFERSHWRGAESGYPFRFADQDVLNAILATPELAPRVDVRPSRQAPTPPFAELRVADARTLRCVYPDGSEPHLVHHHTVKPWLEPTHAGVYSRLLLRLLDADDVPIRVAREDLPPRFRRGLRGAAARKRVNLRERARWHIGDPLRARLRGAPR